MTKLCMVFTIEKQGFHTKGCSKRIMHFRQVGYEAQYMLLKRINL